MVDPKKRGDRNSRKPTKKRLRSEAIEPRILMSGTWIDPDTESPVNGPTSGDDIYQGTDLSDSPLPSGAGNDILHGGAGDDVLLGGTDLDILMGGSGNDTLSGDSGDDVLFGGSGNDTLTGGENADTLIGGTGDDDIRGGSGHDHILGGSGNDVLIGGDGNDVIVSGSGSDDLQGRGGDDTFRFTGAQNGDTFTVLGGSGSDTVDLTEFGSGALLSDDGSTLEVSLGGNSSFTVNYSGIESIVTADTAGNHGPDADAGDAAAYGSGVTATLDGNGSNDFDGESLTYTWQQIDGPTVTLSSASAQNPTFITPTVTEATSLTFSVTVSNGTTSHIDTVTIWVGDTDTLAGTSSNDNLNGSGSTADTIFGLDGDDTIDGGDGNDHIQGGSGADVIDGGGGNEDVLSYRDADSSLTVDIGAGTASDGDTFSNIEIVEGSEYDDTFITSSGSDHVDGGHGKDTAVFDTSSNLSIDLTTGTATGDGTDTLTSVEAATGGSGDDRFVFSAPEAGAVYTIDGGAGTNTIDISQFAFAHVTFGDGHIDVSINESDSFRITYSNISNVAMSDAEGIYAASVVSGTYTGPIVLFSDAAAVSIGAPSSASIALSYDATLDSLSISSVSGTDSSDNLVIRDLSGSDLIVSTITMNSSLGNLDVGTSVTTVAVADGVSVGEITVNSGSGTIGTLAFSGTVSSHTLVTGSITDITAGGLSSTITVTGNLSSFDSGSVISGSITVQALEGSFDGTWPSTSMSMFFTPAAAVVIESGGFQYAATADAGPEQNVAEGSTVTLDSTASTEPNGGSLTYSWTQLSGPAVTLSSTTSAQPTFTAPEGAGTYTLSFRVAVSDGTSIVYDDVTVSVVGNTLPSAQSVYEGEILTFSTSSANAIEINEVGSTSVTVELTAEHGILEFPSLTGITVEAGVNGSPSITVSGTVDALNAAFDGLEYTADGGYTGMDTITVVQRTSALHSLDNDSDLLLRQDFEDGLLATDTSPGGTNDGTFEDNARVVYDEARGNVLSLDGSGDHVLIEGLLGEPTDVTLSAWINLSDSDDAEIVSIGNNVVLRRESDGTVIASFHDGTTWRYTVSSWPIPEGSWHHVAYTVSSSGDQILYIDGDEAGRTTYSGSISYEHWGSDTFIGEHGSGDDNFEAAGLLDDARVYGRALSAAEIATLADNLDPTEVSSIAVTVLDNIAPTSNAGPDQTVAATSIVTLDGTSSVDPEGQSLTYSWIQTGGQAVTLSNTSTASPTFSAPDLTQGAVLTFQLAVGDGTSTSYDTVAVTVQPGDEDDESPSASAGPDQVISEASSVTLDASASLDPDGESLTYAWTQVAGPAVTLSDTSSVQPTFIAPDTTAGATLVFRVAVDNGDQTSFDSVIITVTGDNDAPTANAGNDQVVTRNTTATLDASGSTDPEGQYLGYTWIQTGGPIVTLSDNNVPAPTFTTPDTLAGAVLTFQVAVTDGNTTTYDTVTISVPAVDPPVASAGPDQTVNENASVTLDASASTDPEGQGLTYTWTQTAGPTVTLSDSNAAQPTFTAPETLAGTTLTFQVAVTDGNTTTFDTVTINVTGDDDAPVASAGPDQTVNENAPVTLDASASTDPEGQGLIYTWTQTAGPTVTLSDSNAAQPTFTAPETLAGTTLTFQVAVTDGNTTTFDTVTINVTGDDDAPVASAGPDQTVNENAPVTLDASASTDPEGQGLIYTWTQTAGPTVTLSDSNAAQPTFTAPETLAGTTLTFQAAVTDGNTTTFDTVTINVSGNDDAPVASAGPDQTVNENAPVTLDASASTDPEGQGLTYTWTQTAGPTVTLSDSSVAQPTFTAPETLAGTTLTFRVAVDDGNTTTFDTVTINVTGDDDAPVASAGPDQTVNENAPVTLDASASTDPEGQGLTYTWTQTAGPTVTLSDSSVAQPTFTAPETLAGTTLTFRVAVDDGNTTTFDTVTVNVSGNDDAPVASAGPDQTVNENAPVTLDASASTDPEGQGLTYTWTQTAGPTVTLSDSSVAQPTFTAPETLAGTTLTFRVAVDDGNTTTFDTVTINVTGDDDAPVASAGPDQTVNENAPVTLDASASTDPEGQGLIYTWTQTAGPTVTLSDSNAAQPTFTAPETLAGTTLTFQVAVTDGNTTTFDTVTINVTGDDDAPVASAGPDQTVNENASVALDASASTDPEGQGLTYTWTQTAGPTVTLSDSNAAQPTFTAPETLAGTTLTFRVAVDDGNTTTFDTVTINVTGDDDAPVASAGPDQTVNENASVTLDASASTDPEGQGLTYTWTQAAGPTVTLSDSSVAQPTFTAPETLAGTTLTFRVAVDDGNTTTFDTVTINVTGNDDAPVASAGPDQTVNENAPVTLDASASTDPEGQGLTYTWTQTAGPTVTLSDSNAAQPTFTAPETLAGTTLTFRVAVDDGNTTTFDTVTINVSGDDDAPAASAGPDQTVNENAPVALDASASTDPEGQGLTYTWTQTAGPTVTLSDSNAAQPTFTAPETLAGTTLTFRVAVDDGNTTTFDTVTINVTGDDDAPVASAGPDQTVNENASVTLDASASTDPEGQGLTYTWTQTAGPTVTLSDSNAAQPTFTAPETLAGTTLTFQVAVTDGNTTTFDTVTINVTGDDDAPVASAGPDQTVNENASVTLDASASTDPEGQGLTYTWTQTAGPTVTLSDSNAAQPTFTAPETLAGTTLTFRVAVDDGNTTTFDTVTINVSGDDDAPVASAGPDQTVNENAPVTLDASASTDPEGQGLIYTWTQTAGPTVTLSDSNAAQPTFTAPETLAGTTLTFQVAVTDGNTTTFDTVTISVTDNSAPPNEAPTANAGFDQVVTGAALVTLDATASSDHDGDELTYTWTQIGGPEVEMDNAHTGQPTFTAPVASTAATLTFRVAVFDGVSTTYDTVDVHVEAVAPPNPVILAPPSTNTGTSVVLDASQTTVDGAGELSFQWQQQAGPSVLLVNGSSAVASFVAPNAEASYTLVFSVSISNGVETIHRAVQIDVDAAGRSGATSSTPSAPPTVPSAAQPTDPNPNATKSDSQDTTDHRGSQREPEGAIAPAPTESAPPTDRTDHGNDGDPERDTYEPDRDHRDQAPQDVVGDLAVSAGPDISAKPGDYVNLHAMIRSDAAWRAEWHQMSGPSVAIQGDQQAEAGFFVPQHIRTTTLLLFQLEVTDGETVVQDRLTVRVEPDARNDYLVDTMAPARAGDRAELIHPLGSTPNATFAWRQLSGPPVELRGADTPFPTFDAPDVFVPELIEFEAVTSIEGEEIVRRVVARIDPIVVHKGSNSEDYLSTTGPQSNLADTQASDHDAAPPPRGIGTVWAGIMGALMFWRKPASKRDLRERS